MKSRTKKLLSLLLATAMVFTMNTFAFGAEEGSSSHISSIIDVSTKTNATEYDFREEGKKDAQAKSALIKEAAEMLGFENGKHDGENGFDSENTPYNDLPDSLDEVFALQEMYNIPFFTEEEMKVLDELENGKSEEGESAEEEAESKIAAAGLEEFYAYETGFINEFKNLGSSNYYDAYNEAYEEYYLPSTRTNASVSSNVDTWYAYCDEAIMAPLFVGQYEASEKKSIMSDHIINGKPVSISYNFGGYEAGFYGAIVNPYVRSEKKDGKVVNKLVAAEWDGSVSSNVFKLADGKYLVVAYMIDGGEYNYDNGTDKNVPMAYFNGKKYVDITKRKYDKSLNRKLDKTQNPDIRVEAAIVTQDAGKAPVLVANSLSKNSKGKDMISITVKPKNNQYANVSGNETINYGHVDISAENPSLKSGARPLFTISVKLDKDLKDYKKLLKNATGQKGKVLGKEEFLFDIARNTFAYHSSGAPVSENDIDGTRHVALPFKHTTLTPGYDQYDDEDYFIWRAVTTDSDKVGNYGYVGSLALFTDAKKVGKGKLPVYVVNGSGDKETTSSGTGFNRKGSYSQYKLVEKKDFTVDTSLGNGILLLKPAGNFEGDGAVFRNAEYTIPAGYAGSKKDSKVTEIRAGVYDLTGKDKDNWYVDSAE